MTILRAKSGLAAGLLLSVFLFTGSQVRAANYFGPWDTNVDPIITIDCAALVQVADANNAFTGPGIVRKTGAANLYFGQSAQAARIELDAGARIEIMQGLARNEYSNNGGGNGWANNKADLYIASGATFDNWDGATIVGALLGNGLLYKGNVSGTHNFTMGAGNASGEFNGTFGEYSSSRTLHLIKIGTGTQTIAPPTFNAAGVRAGLDVQGGRMILKDWGIGRHILNTAVGATTEFNISGSNTLTASSGQDNSTSTQSYWSGGGTVVKSGTGTMRLGAGGGTLGRRVWIRMDKGALIDVQEGTLANDWNAGIWTLNQSSMNIAAGAKFETWDNRDVALQVDALTGAGAITNTTGTSNYIVLGIAGGSGEFAGTFSDNPTGGHISLVKSGAGTQTLSGTVSTMGDVTVNAGTLIISNAASLSTVGNINLVGGTLNVTGSSATIASGKTLNQGAGHLLGSVTLNGGSVQWTAQSSDDLSAHLVLADGALATFNTNGYNATFATPGLGAGNTSSIMKSGAGVLTLNAANNYSGGTAVSAGTLVYGAVGAIPDASSVQVSSGATLAVGPGQTFTRSDVVWDYGSALGGTGTYTPGSSMTLDGFTGVSTLSPGIGAGNVGTLNIGCNLTINSANALFYDVSGSVSDKINVEGSLDVTSADLAFSTAPVNGTYTVMSATSAPTIGSITSNLTQAAQQIRGYNAAFSVSGNDVVMDVTSTSKTLEWAPPTPTGTWNLMSASNWTDSTLTQDVFYNRDDVHFADLVFTRTVVVDGANVNPNTVTIDTTATDYSFNSANNGRIVGTGIFTMNGPGTATVNADVMSQFKGTVVVYGGNLVAAGQLGAGTIKVEGGILTASGDTACGTATVIVDYGTLYASGAKALGVGDPARIVTVNGGGTLDMHHGDMYGGHTTSAIPTIVVNAGGVLTCTDGHQELSNLVLHDGFVTSTADAGGDWGTWNINGTGVTSTGISSFQATSGNGIIMLQSGDMANPSTSFDVQDGILTLANNVVDGRNGAANTNWRATTLIKNGAGTLQMLATTEWTGNTIINGGTVEFNSLVDQQLRGGTISGDNVTLVKSGGSTLMFGAGDNPEYVSLGGNSQLLVLEGTLRNEYGNGNWSANKADLFLAEAATLDLWDSPGGITVDALTGKGTVKKGWGTDPASTSLTIGVNNGSGTFAGTITDGYADDDDNRGKILSLVKEGSGVEILTGPLTYHGNTAINGGTLQISTPGNVTLSTITGAGTLIVTDGTTLAATSINLGTLQIGGPAVSAVAVPEPCSLILLAFAACMALVFRGRLKK